MQIAATMSGTNFETVLTKIAGFENAGPLMARALNSAGEGLRRYTVVAEAAQTGLAGDVIDRAQQSMPASAGRLAFTIVARGGNVRLKYFGAKEEGGGVTAHPWGLTSYYTNAFMKSGRLTNRFFAPSLNGQVYTPGLKNVSRKNDKAKAGRQHKGNSIGSWYRKIHADRSGLFIPTELTRGATKAAFEAGAAAALESIAKQLFTALAD